MRLKLLQKWAIKFFMAVVLSITVILNGSLLSFLMRKIDKDIIIKTLPDNHFIHSSMPVPMLKEGDSNSSHVHKGLRIDLWFDVCLTKGVQNFIWHPLFPRIPQHRHILMETDVKFIKQNDSLKRIYGYLYVEQSANYMFQFQFDGSFDFVLRSSNKEMVYFFQPSKRDQNQPNNPNSKSVFLKYGFYYIDCVTITNIGKILWKNNQQAGGFSVLDSIFHTTEMVDQPPPSFLFEKYQIAERFPLTRKEGGKNKYNFFKIPLLPPSPERTSAEDVCQFYVQKPKQKIKLFAGIFMIDNIVVYPQEHYEFLDNMKPGRILMPKATATKIASQVMTLLNKNNSRKLGLEDIIHVHTNFDRKFKEQKDKRRTYFHTILLVKDTKSKEIFQVSNFVKATPRGVCFVEGFQKWNPRAEIFLLTPVKNQIVWVKYLLKMLTDLLEATDEHNVTLVLLDNQSKDGNYKQLLLANPRIKSKYISVKGEKFSKVKLLNRGLEAIPKDTNNVGLVLDLHLQLPLDFFDRTRKTTIQGKTVFTPTLMRFVDPCFHEQYTETRLKKVKWQDDGPGIIAMYKSDWTRVGGFNEKMFAERWGGEDWELVDRIIMAGLHVVHYRLRRFYHLYHNRKAMWDTIKSTKASTNSNT